MDRKPTRQVKVKDIYRAVIPDHRPVNDQYGYRDEATLAQIRQLYSTGCDIVRLAVPDMEAAEALPGLSGDWCAPGGRHPFRPPPGLEGHCCRIAKLRINPGNIGSHDRIEAVAKAAAERGSPSGSVSIQAHWRRTSTRNTAASPRRG